MTHLLKLTFVCSGLPIYFIVLRHSASHAIQLFDNHFMTLSFAGLLDAKSGNKVLVRAL